jgi:hypothetical protein
MEGWRQRRLGSKEDHSTTKGNYKTALTLTGLLMEGLGKSLSPEGAPKCRRLPKCRAARILQANSSRTRKDHNRKKTKLFRNAQRKDSLAEPRPTVQGEVKLCPRNQTWSISSLAALVWANSVHSMVVRCGVSPRRVSTPSLRKA